MTNKGGEQTTQLVGVGTGANKMCFRLLGTQSKAFLPHFVLNMHDEWPKCHKLEKLNGFVSSSENVKNRSTLYLWALKSLKI